MDQVQISLYQPVHQPWFEQFNKSWIEKYFWMEPIDYEVLENPQLHIIDKGGQIFMATYHNEIVGTVALKYLEPGLYEFTKMAVTEKYQGKKIGLALSQAAIDYARKCNATKIILYSNTLLEAAIRLYSKLGFVEIPLDGPYKRSNIKMELELKYPPLR